MRCDELDNVGAMIVIIMSRFQRLDRDGGFFPGVARSVTASRLPLAVTCRAFGAWILMSGAVPGGWRAPATASRLHLAFTCHAFGASFLRGALIISNDH